MQMNSTVLLPNRVIIEGEGKAYKRWFWLDWGQGCGGQAGLVVSIPALICGF